ncbi:hypothetical protein NP233_g507 [Leucocoprinus birnbaumii]|uniref:Terpene synthase n=1 Tax=Leucocoprinus birnbaumii TaxID=56174 RepID=A0AAD5W226_9AGAR|nr:hypothetical protein NP233_g507 [Leucocoprinus birnbaumii]
MSPQSFKLPMLLAGWPWLRTINPLHEEVSAESIAWVESFEPFSPKAQEKFKKWDIDHLRTACDLLNFIFILDEYTDRQNATQVGMTGEIVMDALRNPFKPRPGGESLVGEMARQLWARTLPIITSEKAHQRFLRTFELYLESVVIQAVDRSQVRVRGIKDYLERRRDNIAVKPVFAILELTLDIPNFAMEHLCIQNMMQDAIDMITISNDLNSFKVEHTRGDDSYNIITIARKELGYGIEQTIKWVGEYHNTLRRHFLSSLGELPSWGAGIDEPVAEYIYGIANWVRANDTWGFETPRYFGDDGLAIQSHRIVDLACGHPECAAGYLQDKARN